MFDQLNVSKNAAFADEATKELLFAKELMTKEALESLNLTGFKPNVLDTLCDFIDVDNSGSFGYAEFARILAAEDIMTMAPLTEKKNK